MTAVTVRPTAAPRHPRGPKASATSKSTPVYPSVLDVSCSVRPTLLLHNAPTAVQAASASSATIATRAGRDEIDGGQQPERRAESQHPPDDEEGLTARHLVVGASAQSHDGEPDRKEEREEIAPQLSQLSGFAGVVRIQVHAGLWLSSDLRAFGGSVGYPGSCGFTLIHHGAGCSNRSDVAVLDEYCPTLPGADGRGSNRGPKLKAVLAAEGSQAPRASGSRGTALLQLPAAAPMSRQGAGPRSRCRRASGAGAPWPPDEVARQPLRAASTAASKGDLGSAFGSVLLVSSFGLAGAAWMRFRRRRLS